MKKQPKPIVRTRVDFIGVNVRRMTYAPNLNGVIVTVRRTGTSGDAIRTYHSITDASLLRIARVGRAIGQRSEMKP